MKQDLLNVVYIYQKGKKKKKQTSLMGFSKNKTTKEGRSCSSSSSVRIVERNKRFLLPHTVKRKEKERKKKKKG